MNWKKSLQSSGSTDSPPCSGAHCSCSWSESRNPRYFAPPLHACTQTSAERSGSGGSPTVSTSQRKGTGTGRSRLQLVRSRLPGRLPTHGALGRSIVSSMGLPPTEAILALRASVKLWRRRRESWGRAGAVFLALLLAATLVLVVTLRPQQSRVGENTTIARTEMQCGSR